MRLEPGVLRAAVVSVGRHVAPAAAELPVFLKRFADVYGPLVQPTPQGLVAAVAAHHRLAWIHPFLDGNGRVTRLFTQALYRPLPPARLLLRRPRCCHAFRKRTHGRRNEEGPATRAPFQLP